MKKLIKILCVSLSLLMIVGCFAACGNSASADGTTYVSMRINPEIELVANADGEVISVTAVNEDGDTVLAEVDLIGMSIEDAGEAFTKTATELGYIEITATDSTVYIDVQSVDDEKVKDIKDKLTLKINGFFNNNGIYGKVKPETVEKYADKVSEWNVSAGHAKMIIRILDLYPEMTADEVISLSVAQRIALINDNAKNNGFTAEIHKEYVEKAKALKAEYTELYTIKDQLKVLDEKLKSSAITEDEKEQLQKEFDALKVEHDALQEQLKAQLDALKTERKLKVQESKNKFKNKAADRRAKNAEKLQKHLEKIGADIDAVIADIVQWRNGK